MNIDESQKGFPMHAVDVQSGFYGSATMAQHARVVPDNGVRAHRAQTRSSIRLTRRGRILVMLVLVSAFLVGWSTLGGSTADASVESSSIVGQVVVVQQGESLWSIAQDIAPSTDPREVILRIREMNNLGTDHVFPGQSLHVPSL